MSVLLDDKQRDIVKMRNGKYVCIDTCWTMDHGWETMVFSCNKEGKVIKWQDLDCDIYTTKEEADKGHCEMVNKWIHR